MSDSVASSTVNIQSDEPHTAVGWGYKIAKDFGLATIFACVLGLAAKTVYENSRIDEERRYADNKAHQVELMAYLTNRNDSDAKRAVADAELARSLNRLADALDQLRYESRTTSNTQNKTSTQTERSKVQ